MAHQDDLADPPKPNVRKAQTSKKRKYTKQKIRKTVVDHGRPWSTMVDQQSPLGGWSRARSSPAITGGSWGREPPSKNATRRASKSYN